TRPSSPILIRGADSPGVSGPAAPWGGGLVLLPPVVDQHLGLQHQVQRIEIEELLSQVPFVGLDERILPWRTWLDVVRCRAPSPAPPMQGLGDELRTTVAAHIGGRASSCAIRSRTSTVPLVVIRLAALPASASDELLGHVQDLDRHFPDDRAEARLASACSADRPRPASDFWPALT